MLVGEGLLVVWHLTAVAALHDETARVDEPAALACLGFGEALLHHGRDEHLANAGTGLTGSEEEEGVLVQGNAGEIDGAWGKG